ncbi:hypothetical protein E2C01_065509 [Portunus trituberculatus]|uniref:Uncharacterized protein n=1 Tax=Portunus trituberculatus TaxID=210409 RepID=A0A5B7HPS7_PORTR|nr:hypothetical protein [Portunus trituberculatus]
MLYPLRHRYASPPRCTRLFSSSSHLILSTSNARINQYSQSFIPSSGKLWRSLPVSIFPSSYDVTSFKREASRHLSLLADSIDL